MRPVPLRIALSSALLALVPMALLAQEVEPSVSPQATEPAEPGQEVEPAVSGHEESVIYTDGTTAVAVPGADAPVVESREGNVTHLDFTQGEVGQVESIDQLTPEDATIIHADVPVADADPPETGEE